MTGTVCLLEDSGPLGGGPWFEDARQFGVDHVDIGGAAGEGRKFRMDAQIVAPVASKKFCHCLSL
jgi:hypothetical protein